MSVGMRQWIIFGKASELEDLDPGEHEIWTKERNATATQKETSSYLAKYFFCSLIKHMHDTHNMTVKV